MVVAVAFLVGALVGVVIGYAFRGRENKLINQAGQFAQKAEQQVKNKI